MIMPFKLFLSLTLLFLAIVFILQNTVVVEIRFLFWTVTMSRGLLVAVSLVIGMIFSWLLRGLFAIRRKR